MKEVSSRKFEVLMDKSLKVKHKCPECGYPGANIVIEVRMYGREGAKAVCPECSFETKHFRTNDCFSDGKGRLGTPVTPKSLLRGIWNAVNSWNQHSREGGVEE